MRGRLGGMAEMKEGERVRLKANSTLSAEYPELANATGVISSTFGTSRTRRLHVRFTAPADFIALHVPEVEFEPVDNLEPRAKEE